MEYTELSHCVYKCEYHIVLVTKYRKEVFNEGIFEYMKKQLEGLMSHYPLIRIKEINHDKDHVHIEVSLPPTMSVGKAIGIIKQNTSKGLKQKFPKIKEIYWGTESFWSEGYFVSTIGLNEAVIRKYIKHQGQKDSGQTKFEAD